MIDDDSTPAVPTTEGESQFVTWQANENNARQVGPLEEDPTNE